MKSRSAVTDNSRKTLGLYPSRDFPSRLHRVGLVPNRPRILCESVANRWKIGQENSLGQTSADSQEGYRTWLLGQRGGIATAIICELPGNSREFILFAERMRGRRRRALLRSRTTLGLREVPEGFKGDQRSPGRLADNYGGHVPAPPKCLLLHDAPAIKIYSQLAKPAVPFLVTPLHRFLAGFNGSSCWPNCSPRQACSNVQPAGNSVSRASASLRIVGLMPWQRQQRDYAYSFVNNASLSAT